MKTTITLILCWIGMLAGFSSCEKGAELPEPSLLVRFDLTLESRTRAPQNLNTSTHTAKVYMFREETPGSGRYVYSGEQNLTGSSLTVGGLLPSTKYRFVFLAIPRNQQPALPTLTTQRPPIRMHLPPMSLGHKPQTRCFAIRSVLRLRQT